MELIQQLGEYRLSRGMSQAELAGKLRVSFFTINRWFNGKTRPGPLQEHRIKELLGESGPGRKGSLFSGLPETFINSIKATRDSATGKEEILISYRSLKGHGSTLQTCDMSGKDLAGIIDAFNKKRRGGRWN